MIGRMIHRFDIIDSTNDYVKTNISTLNHGDIVTSLTQTKGRGRFGNYWISEIGNLYFSLVIKESTSRNQIFPLMLKTSVSIYQTLKEYGLECQIKYPNDIIFNKKKIAGILIESIGYEEIDSIVIGVGININQTDFKNLNDTATSLKKITGKEEKIENVLNDYVKMFNSLDSNNSIFKIYQDILTFEKKHISYNGKQYEILDIDRNGHIKVKIGKENKYLNYNNLYF